ncbi:MAG: hypothetical protein AB1742_06040 [bacterium]
MTFAGDAPKKKYYSLREVSDALKIPKSTIVKYKDFFPDLLPMCGDGKRKKFPAGALEVLGEIRDMRENRKLDWLEIGDILRERRAPAQAPNLETAAVAPARPDRTPAKLDHLVHLVYAIASKMLEQSAETARLNARLAQSGKRIARLELLAAATVRALQELNAATANNDKKNRRRIETLLASIRAEFFALQRERLKELEKKTPQDAKEQTPEPLADLVARIEKLTADSATFQTKYQYAMRENETLRRKLNELFEPSRRREKTGKGFLGIFSRGR